MTKTSLHSFVKTRNQLTRFAPMPDPEALEATRMLLDPVQASLIAAHVTLRFGAAETFSGHGILLPSVAGEQEFQALRQLI